MKFSSTDKISKTVCLIRSKKIYFIDRNKCIIITEIECWPVFKQDPNIVILALPLFFYGPFHVVCTPSHCGYTTHAPLLEWPESCILCLSNTLFL